MKTFDPALLNLLTTRNVGTLITIKRDGRPQASNVNYEYDADASRIRVSITDGRAKTINVRRDPRASLHVSSPDGWSYTVVEGDVTLSDVAAELDDAAVEELIDVYRKVRGEDHPELGRLPPGDGRRSPPRTPTRHHPRLWPRPGLASPTRGGISVVRPLTRRPRLTPQRS